MTTYNTGNPIGSTDPRDLYDNAENLDNAVNTNELTWTDRFGVVRRSMAGATGYENLGDYTAGLEFTNYNQVLLYSGEFYRAAAATSLPFTTSGVWATDEASLVSVGDAVLRGELGDGIRRVDTIATLRGISGRFAGDAAQLLGYYAAGDGGGGPVRMWKTGTVGTYVDNGGSIIVPTGGDGSGAWVWEYSGAINVKWFGYDIQAAIDYSGSLHPLQVTVIIPSGNYTVDTTITVTKPITIKGDGFITTGTRLFAGASLNAPMFYVTAGAIFSDITLLGSNNPANTNESCIQIENSNNVTFDKVTFYNMYDGIDVIGATESFYLSIRDCRFENSLSSYITINNSSLGGVDLIINDTRFLGSVTSYGLHFVSGL